FQEGFAWGVADHHGLHNAAILACILGLAMGGMGWTARIGELQANLAERFPAYRTARRWFLLAGVAAAAGLWVSAVTMSIALAGLGLGAISLFCIFGRRLTSVAESTPDLWRWWGYSAAASSVFFYLLEYFPHHLAMRLEVNHPLYSLAL